MDPSVRRTEWQAAKDILDSEDRQRDCQQKLRRCRRQRADALAMPQRVTRAEKRGHWAPARPATVTIVQDNPVVISPARWGRDGDDSSSDWWSSSSSESRRSRRREMDWVQGLFRDSSSDDDSDGSSTSSSSSG